MMARPAPSSSIAHSLLPLDGRRQRSEESRQRIVTALLDLVGEGHLAPGAEQVAERAGVGLRSVFRHFKDMDSLFSEMCERIATTVEAGIRQPFFAADWRGQMQEMIARRAVAFEMIAPFQRASQVHRHRSPALLKSHALLVRTLRQALVDRLPRRVVEDTDGVEALDMLLSIETWQRLRDVQGLALDEAKQVLLRAVRPLLDQAAGLGSQGCPADGVHVPED